MTARETHDVTLEWPDGRTRTVAVREEETVLEAAERATVSLPFGCRTGACGTCTGRVLEGDEPTSSISSEDDSTDVDVADIFEYQRPPRALKERHRDAGYVLLCIASPQADCRVAVGSSVHAELVDNPWK